MRALICGGSSPLRLRKQISKNTTDQAMNQKKREANLDLWARSTEMRESCVTPQVLITCN